jgi:hypothetical protein
VNNPCLHIIHLPHRADRLTLLTNELSTQQINNFRIWDGVLDEELPCRGIIKSHKQIIFWAQQNGLKEICIAEDDIQFSIPGAFSYFIERTPATFDLYLGGILWGNIHDDQTVTDFAGTMLYIAKEQFYETILNLPEDKDYDRQLAGLGQYCVCSPMVAFQFSGYSDNKKCYIDFTPYAKRMKWSTQ